MFYLYNLKPSLNAYYQELVSRQYSCSYSGRQSVLLKIIDESAQNSREILLMELSVGKLRAPPVCLIADVFPMVC